MISRSDARPLRLEELKRKLPKVAWIEMVYSVHTEPKIPARIRINPYLGSDLVFTDKDSLQLNTYGATWRVWPDTEPTREQMDKAAWIREDTEEKFEEVRIL